MVIAVASSPSLSQDFLVDQWFLCGKACFNIPIEIEQQLRRTWTKNTPLLFTNWAQQFQSDLFGAHYGYASAPPKLEPYTEICIETLLKKAGVLHHCLPLIEKPTLCITHDIDHLGVSSKLALKRLISERKLTSFKKDQRSFIPSLRKLLELSSTLSQSSRGAATIFAASPLASKNPFYWPMQWLMDPSYKVTHSQFHEFKALIEEFQCDLGLHGSFYSLSQNFLGDEKNTLELAMNQKVTLLRQHWLHLPGKRAWDIIKESKFQIDSTLGWNGAVGFRGGMARPFEILIDRESKSTLWEVPLLLMDGPLFCDLKQPFEEIKKLVQDLLMMVMQRGGCVAINWHDRAAHPSYQWDGLLEEIILVATKNNFRFLTLKEAVEACLDTRFKATY